MLLQKPAFLLFYHARAAEASFGEWLGVLWHGLSLDCTVAGYVTAFPVLVALASFWIPLSQRVWRIVLTVYFSLIALILDINYFLKEFVPGLTEEIASHSIYDFIENVLGMQIITSKRRITVEHATVRDEKLLDMDGYDCVAVVVNQTFNSDGMLFEYTQSRHQPDYFCFQDIATRKK